MRNAGGWKRAAGWLLMMVLIWPRSAAAAFDRTHPVLDGLLHRYVDRGRVDYAGLVAETHTLQTYLHSLETVSPGELAGWPQHDQLALWINAYNAFVLMSVLEYYPLSRHTLVGLAFPANSIWQVPGVWKNPRWRVAGRSVSLDSLEHEIIRPAFREPRIHFALVCAARSCPNLRSEAYRGDRLDSQLEDQARQFFGDPIKGLRLDRESRRAVVSKIFDWYGVDFASGQAGANRDDIERSILRFAASRAPDAASSAFLLNAAHLAYLPYDWTLNDRGGH